jgi:hypothetical protein
MNLSGQKSRLTGLTRQLSLDWAETKSHWSDDRSREFETRHLAELFANVDRAALMLDKLEILLSKVRSDCE